MFKVSLVKKHHAAIKMNIKSLFKSWLDFDTSIMPSTFLDELMNKEVVLII